MSQTASNWRAKLAVQIAQRYHSPAALLVGSVARDLADAASDLDILLYWETIPAEPVRQEIIAQIGGTITAIGDSSDGESDPALQSASESFLVGTTHLKIDITHKTLAAVEKLIEDVTQHADTHPIKLAALNGMQSGKVLTGGETLLPLLRRIIPVPDQLRDRLLAQQLQHMAWEQTARLVWRGDEWFARKRLVELCEQMVSILLLVNRCYPPLTSKHFMHTIQSLTDKPQECERRFMQVLQEPLPEAYRTAFSLYTDLLDVLDATGYATASIRSAHQFTINQHDQPYELQEESNHHA